MYVSIGIIASTLSTSPLMVNLFDKATTYECEPLAF